MDENTRQNKSKDLMSKHLKHEGFFTITIADQSLKCEQIDDKIFVKPGNTK